MHVRSERLAKTSYEITSAKNVYKNENTTYINITRTRSVPSNRYIVIDHASSISSGGESHSTPACGFASHLEYKLAAIVGPL